MEFENRMLNDRLKQVSMNQLSKSQTQAAERDRKKQQDFDTRMMIEGILRKTIKNFDMDYEQEAVSCCGYMNETNHIEQGVFGLLFKQPVD